MRETNYEEGRWVIFLWEEQWVIRGILERSLSEKLGLGNVFSAFSWEGACFKPSLLFEDDVFV